MISILIIWALFAKDSDVSGGCVMLVLMILVPTFIFGAINYIFFYPHYKFAKLLDSCISLTRQQKAEITQKVDESEKIIHGRIADVRRDCLAFISRDAQKYELTT